MWKLTDREKDKELRKAFVDTLSELMSENKKLVCVEADLGGASGTTALAEKYPDQFIQAGISEANMIGMACGMSMRGYIPFVHTFSPFSTRRALDQIYLEGAYADNTINIYGSDPGVCAAANGGTHNTFEDITIMRAIPNTIVLAPADSVAFEWAIKEVSKLKGVHYLRANRKGNPPIYEEGSSFELGKSNVLKKGDKVAIFALGELVKYALEAADELEKKGISAEVIDVFSVKPFDVELVVKEAQEKKLLVSFENHSVAGGIGSIIAEIIAEKGLAAKLVRIGARESFGQVGAYDDLRKAYGFTKENLVETIEKEISK